MALWAARCSDSFLLLPQAAAKAAAADLGGDLEALAVVGALFVEHLVAGRDAELALGELLQERLEVAAELAGDGRLDLGADVVQDELLGRGHAAVQVDRGDQRLERRGQHRARHLRVGRHAFAEDEVLVAGARASLMRAHVSRLTTTDLILVSSPSEYSGYCMEQPFADDHAEDGVAEELHPLVRGEPVLHARGVGEGGLQQLQVAKRVARSCAWHASRSPAQIAGV